jgi:hypothetical protein
MRRQFDVSYWLLTFCLLVGVPCISSQTQRPPSTSQSRLTVDDVIKMLQVKLGEDLIAAQIRKNKTPFSLSADDMVRLKTAGASDGVIRVMIDPQAPATPPAPATTSVVPMATEARPTPSLPSSYGYYVLEHDRLDELVQVQVVTKFGLKLADRGFAVDGISDGSNMLKIESPTPTIIVYQQNVPTGGLQLSALSFTGNLKAYQFNIINTAPQFFSNLYSKSPNETIPINLWRPSRRIMVRIEPVEGRTGMYKLVPSLPFEPGKYALYFPDSLHESDVVFSASDGREATAFAFEVIGSKNVVSPTSENAPVAMVGRSPVGSLPTTKSDGARDPSEILPLIEVARTRYAFGARKTAELAGTRADTRVKQNDKIKFFGVIPKSYAQVTDLRLFQFEVKNGKRTTTLKIGLACSVSCEGEICRITPEHGLTAGEYGFGDSNPSVPTDGGTMKIFTFGIDPNGG